MIENDNRSSTATPMRPAGGDDLDAYIATLTATERDDLATADAAIDLAVLLYRARERRGLSQAAAAARAGLAQQAVSRLERPQANVQVRTLQRYLAALGFALEVTVREQDTGEVTGSVCLKPNGPAVTPPEPPPRRSARSRRRPASGKP